MFISRLHFPVTALGPGRRIGIWVQGCSIRCPGCISVDTWAIGKRRTSVGAILEQLSGWLSTADGITISGGEPFDQPAALLELLWGLRARFSGDILVYSGHAREAIDPVLQQATGLIDALITDPFRPEAADELPLRGSDNQRLHRLTPLGVDRFSPYLQPCESPRPFDVMFDEKGTVWLAGIPRRNDFQRLRIILEQAGHKAVTSEDRSDCHDVQTLC